MASPHASSFICLPYSNQSDVVLAHTVYFGTCIWSALIGVLGASLFLFQVVKSTQEAHPGISSSQKWILIMLALSDLFADIGKFGSRLSLLAASLYHRVTVVSGLWRH